MDAHFPLSMGQWHAHVNVCVPSSVKDLASLAEDPMFGLEGSIDTQEECRAENGRFLRDLLGWMVHVDLFEPG